MLPPREKAEIFPEAMPRDAARAGPWYPREPRWDYARVKGGKGRSADERQIASRGAQRPGRAGATIAPVVRTRGAKTGEPGPQDPQLRLRESPV